MAARVVVIPLEDTEACTHAIAYYKSDIYRAGDVIHVIHVIPRETALPLGAPSSPPPIEPAAVGEVGDVLVRRALDALGGIEPTPTVHLVKAETDADSIGQIVCDKAKDLGADLVVLARLPKSKLKTFFLGSVTNYCIEHCPTTLIIHQ